MAVQYAMYPLFNILGYTISDQVDFCPLDSPSKCMTKNALPGSLNNTNAVFEVDFTTGMWAAEGADKIDIDPIDPIPIRWQRENCFCNWRLCNTGSALVLNLKQQITLLFVMYLMNKEKQCLSIQ